MKLAKSALVLIGFQNDYFDEGGSLYTMIEERDVMPDCLQRTMSLIDAFIAAELPVVSTPIVFSPDYSELDRPIGILAAIKEFGAFRRGTPGGETTPQLKSYGDEITELPGKRGLNAFSNTVHGDTPRGHSMFVIWLTSIAAATWRPSDELPS